MEVTADSIINFLKERVEKKEAQFDSNFFVETALKLNLLLGDEQDRLAELAQAVAKKKLLYLESQEKRNVSEAKLRIEADPIYLEYKKQDMKCQRIEEFVRLAKKLSDRQAGF